jgi:hypothetical protein
VRSSHSLVNRRQRCLISYARLSYQSVEAPTENPPRSPRSPTLFAYLFYRSGLRLSFPPPDLRSFSGCFLVRNCLSSAWWSPETRDTPFPQPDRLLVVCPVDRADS